MEYHPWVGEFVIRTAESEFGLVTQGEIYEVVEVNPDCDSFIIICDDGGEYECGLEYWDTVPNPKTTVVPSEHVPDIFD